MRPGLPWSAWLRADSLSRSAPIPQLQALDAEVQRQIDSLANKKLVTNHDAFGYYINRYGLQFVGSVIPSFDSSAELSGRDIRDLVAKIKATRVKAVFSETSLPPRAAETIAQEAGVKVVEGEDALYGDSLGPAGSDGDTYLKRPITDEGVAFGSDTATGMTPMAHRVAGVLAIVIYRQEVSPMNAVSAVGAPLQFTIARLR
jgi:hypothetical protein